MIKRERIENLLNRNVEEVIQKEHLREALLRGRELRVKLGIDPTAVDLHLGHAVVLRKLKEFQELGHKVVLIIGDFTGRIGDPSGRSETRKPLTEGEIKKNMKAYLAQAGRIINVKKAEIFYNSHWFLKEGVEKMVELVRASTIQQVLKRADFQKRLKEDNDITLLELLYPLFQGYDSVKVRADVELGGTDQKFNLLMGRRVQRHFDMKEQDVLTVPLLEGLDGVKKMSKSYGNYVGLNEDAESMFGKIMSLPDGLVNRYFLMSTDLDEKQVRVFQKQLTPKDFKERLAREIVTIYHSQPQARAAALKFIKVFSRKEMPTDLPSLKVKAKGMTAMDLAILSGVLKSRSEAWRLISQGGFSVGKETVRDPKAVLSLKKGEVLRIGKKKFFRVKV